MDMNGLGMSRSAAAQVMEADKKQKAPKGTYGRTIGDPQLSEKGKKYYDQLKKKYSNMEFVLVSPDKKEEVERNKGNYASSKELLVLIDSDKIEKMAEDEAYRSQYESILNSATAQMARMKASLGSNASKVRSFGMTFDDHGNASFFAVVDKSLAKQRERIADKKEERRKADREEARKAEKELAKERVSGSGQREETGNADSVTVTAGTWDELLHRIDEVILTGRSDRIITEAEKQVGQQFDFSL